MTIVVEAPELEQVKKQLHKLVNVVKITELEPDRSLEREIMLVRVSAPPGRRSEVLEIANIFKATPVDVGHNSMCLQVAGDPGKINDFLELLRPFGVVDLAKSGRIALARELKSKEQRLRAVN